MTLVRPQDLSFMAGGAVAQRHGVFVRRTSPTEDVAEVFARSTTAPRFDENGVVRNAAINVPRLSWRDFDGDGVYEQAVLPIGPQTTNLIEFNVPGGVPSDFELSPMGVTNQTAEYYVEIDDGDDLQIAAPANWDPNDFTIVVWGRPDWPNDDETQHYPFWMNLIGNNIILVQKHTNDSLQAIIIVAGVAKTLNLTLPFSAGDEIFFALRLNGGSATFYADTDGDNTLETATDPSVGSFGAGSWTAHLGSANDGSSPWLGGLNIAILNDGSSANPITERFNSGNGEDIQEWLEEYGEKLVLYVPKSKEGDEVKALSYASATQLLAEGNIYQLDLPGAGGDYASALDHAALDIIADIDLRACLFMDDWTPAAFETIIAKDDTVNRSFYLRTNAATGVLVLVWNDGAIRTAASTVAPTVSDGDPLWVRATLDVDDGAADSTVTFYTSTDPITTAPDDVTWTQLGAAVKPGFTTSIASTAAILSLGILGNGANNPLSGAIYVAQVYDGIGGTLVLDADFRYLDGAESVVLDQSIYAHPITINGSASIADSGSDISSGSFERYTKTGRHYYDGVDDKITVGSNEQMFDGLDGWAMWFTFTPEHFTGELFSRYNAPNGERQFLIDAIGGADLLRAWFATDLAGNSANGKGDTTLAVGTKYAAWIWYDGTGAANADKLKMGLSVFDPATGTWGAFAAETVGFTNNIPAFMTTPTSSVEMLFGDRVDGTPYKGFLDDWRIWLGAANRPATAQLDLLTVYDEVTGIPSTCFEPDHWWTFRGDADDERAHSGTFVRNDTGRSYGADGLVRAIAANELRNRCFVEAGDGNKYMVALLEAGFTNLNTEDDLQNWVKSGTPVITANVSDPAGGTAAFTVEDNAGGANEYIEREMSFTGDAVKSVAIAIRENTMPGTGDQEIRIVDTLDGGAYRLRLRITSWSSGEPQITMDTGTLLFKFLSYDGYWILLCQTSAVTAANTNMLRLHPAATVAAVGKFDVFLVDAYNSAFPPYSLLSEAETTTKDELKKPISGWTPDQGYTLYGKIVNFMLANQGVERYAFSAGDEDTAGSAISLRVKSGTDHWQLRTRTTASGVVASTIGGGEAPTVGDVFEFRISVPASGDLTWYVTKNGGSESAGQTQSPGAWDSAFNALFFFLSMNGSSSNQGNAGHIEWKAESTAGLSLAQMQALDQPDLFYWHAGMGLSDVDGSVSGALDWYDGRQPEGWTFSSMALDRATNSEEGTYSLRCIPTVDAGSVFQTPSLTSGKWYSPIAEVKAQASSARMRASNPARIDFSETTSGLGTFERLGAVAEALLTAPAGPQFDGGGSDTDYFHVDNARFFEFAEPAFDTATKGDAIPGIDGLGGPWGIADASSVVASSEGIPLPYDSDFGTTVMKLESGPAGSGTRRYLFGLPGTLNSFTPNTLGGMVVGIYIPSSSEITPAQVTTHAVDDQGSSAGDVATATDRWEWLWVTRTWDGSATEAYLELRFADGVSLSGADEVLYMAIPTGADGAIPLVPIPQIAEGTSVVEEEDFYAAFEIPPGVAGFYVELIAWAPGGLLYIGAAGDSGARLMLEYATDGTLLIFFSDGTSTSQKASASTVSPGSNIKVLGTVTATGILQVTISIDDAAEEESALSGALALPDDWGAQRAYLGSKGGGDHATVEILEAKAVRDSTYSLTEVGAVT